MDRSDSPNTRRACPEPSRKDGWTPQRQLRFLYALSRVRSVTRAAAYAGMSRESAYRLRARDPHGLFAAAWDHAMEGHKLVNFLSGRRPQEAPVSPGNPPKVTKWRKCTTPGFDALLSQLREL